MLLFAEFYYEFIVLLTQPVDLDMIHQAVFTDPDDSSVWIYHRWLMGHCNPNSMTPLISMITIEERIQYLQKEIELIQELHEMEPENRCK